MLAVNHPLPYSVLPLLLGACAALTPEDKPAPKTAARMGCATAMEGRQASCNPDVLRMQGSECAAATQRIVDRCQELPTAER